MADDVRVVEAAHDMNDGVRAADVREEFVAEALALARTLHEARDVHELDNGGREFLGVVHLREIIEPLVRYGDDADVRVDGAERVVRGFRARVRQCVEQRAFPNVGKPHDA